MNTYQPLINVIDKYIAKADDDIADTLEADGRVLPKESVKTMSTMEAGIASALVAETDYFIKAIKRKKSIAGIMAAMEEIKEADAYCDEIAVTVSHQFKKFMPKLVAKYVANVDGGLKITSMTKSTVAWIDRWSKELADIMKLNGYKQIDTILRRGLENGESVADVARAIMDSGIRNEYYRARMTAVTEMLRAHNVAKHEAAIQNPSIIGKKWRHTGYYKNTPRENHIEMDGQTVPKNEPFTLVGADGEIYYPMFPVDSILPAGEAINCHCIAEDVIDQNILGLSVEERQKLRDEALADMDEEWERGLDAMYREMQAQ